MAISSFQRRLAPVSKGAAAAGALGLAGASLFAATPAFAAEYECEAFDGLPAPTLVADGVCQIVITHWDTPEPTAFTFPAAMGKVQAIVVGAGGGGAAFSLYDDAYDYMAYGGAGGQVAFVDEVALDTPIDIYVGAGGAGNLGDDASDGEPSFFDVTGTDPVMANGGYGAKEYGPGYLVHYDNEANGYTGTETYEDWVYYPELDGDDYYSYYLGAGAGAAGDAVDVTPGPGFAPSELVTEFGADADLFPTSGDDIAYGVGGTGYIEWLESAPSAPAGSDFEDLGTAADMSYPDSGQGGDANFYAYDPTPGIGDAELIDYDAADGADGAVVLRYGAAELAATGVDATAALAAGAVAAAGGAALVGITARRRRANA